MVYPSDTVYLGQPLVIPLCRKFATPGPSPTATPPPPYAAPNLLLPANGAPFTIADDSITLQWASVGSLQEIEAYRVTIEDLTAALGPSLVDQVTDTKYIVPSTLRPTDGVAHIFSWTVEVVRVSGSDESGNPIWVTAGSASSPRYFSLDRCTSDNHTHPIKLKNSGGFLHRCYFLLYIFRMLCWQFPQALLLSVISVFRSVDLMLSPRLHWLKSPGCD